MNPRLTTFISCTILFIVAFFFWSDFTSFSFSFIGGLDDSDIIKMPYSSKILFALSCSLIPVISLIVYTKGKLQSAKQILISIFTTILIGIVFWILRLYWINTHLEELTLGPFDMKIENQLYFNLRIEIFLWIGFVAGGVASFFGLKSTTFANNSQKANASDSVNLKRNASNKR